MTFFVDADIVSGEASALPPGSHCKSLAWSKDGTRLLAGVNSNALLVMKYPDDNRYLLYSAPGIKMY